MKRLVPAALAAVLALCAGTAHAQSSVDADTAGPNPLRKGARSLSILAPLTGGTGRAGIWRMVNDNTNLGLLVGLNVSRSSLDGGQSDDRIENNQLFVSAGLGVRRYANPAGQVVPYVAGQAYVFANRQTQGSDAAETRANSVGVGASGGLGVEWFPVRRVSISGETGLNVQIARGSLDAEVPQDQNVDTSGLGLSTFTSGLAVQIYF